MGNDTGNDYLQRIFCLLELYTKPRVFFSRGAELDKMLSNYGMDSFPFNLSHIKFYHFGE